MAVQAYILVQTEAGRSAAVTREIAQLEGVLRADDVTGPYDVIVHIEGPSVDAVGRLVATTIQQVAGITRTLTCPVVRL